MLSHPKPTRPWEMISVDVIGPLPQSSKGSLFELVVTDHLTKFALTFHLRKSSAEVIVKRIEEHVFLLFSVPKLILCDNGLQFKSSTFLKLATQYNTKIKYNAYYHPRANPTERTHRTIKTMNSMYLENNHKKWEDNLQKVTCALRTAKHDTTRLTLYFVNFGRNMVLSGDDYAELHNREDEIEQEDITGRNIQRCS